MLAGMDRDDWQMTKHRASKLDAVADELTEWFEAEHLTLDQARERLHEDHGIRVSRSRLSQWWARENERRMQQRLLERIATGARFCKQVRSKFSGASPAPDLDTLAGLIRVLVMQLSVRGQADPKTLEIVQRMMRMLIQHERARLKQQEIRIDQRRLELLERRAKQAEQAEEVAGSELSAEQKQERIKQIFGIG